LYEGTLGVIAGQVLHSDISVRQGFLDITSIESPYRQTVRGVTEITFTAEMGENMEWNRSPSGGDMPDIKALLALARRHPDEYDELRLGEAVLKALGG
jgi:hypothetical protein